MTKQFYKLLFLCILFVSCQQKQLKHSTNSLTLITIGLADSATTLNKGYGIRQYIFVDLENDSVFSRIKNSTFEPKEIAIEGRYGFVKNLSFNDTVVRGLSMLDKLPNGRIQGTETGEFMFYDGPMVYLKYIKNNEIKYFCYSYHHLDTAIKNLSILLIRLQDKVLLTTISKEISFNEDSIIFPIFNSGYFKVEPLPKLKTTIKYVAPKDDKKK